MQRTVIVTGASGGVGRALVENLVGQGRRVVAMVLDDREAQSLRHAVPGVAGAIRCDLGRADLVATALSSILGDSGLDLEAIVACAGVWPGAPLETSRLDEIRRTFEINTLAPLALLQATLPALRRSRGRVVFVSSISGRFAFPLNGAYAMSKFALEALADVARRETAGWGIAVTVVQPGPIRSGMVTAMIERLADAENRLPEQERTLYGDLYTGFREMCEKGYPDAVPPEFVANAIMEVLEAESPDTRVPVGAMAKQICDAARTLPDLDLDAIARGLVTGAPLG